jgi:hypothetical protein
MMRLRGAFERVGRTLWPAFSGVIIVEAQKRLYQGLPVASRASRRVFVPVLAPHGVPTTRARPPTRQNRLSVLLPLGNFQPDLPAFSKVDPMSVETSKPVPRAGILDIAAYVPGKEHAPGVARVYKLSSNETPLGASPKAIEAFRAAADNLERYPDGQAVELREAIAAVHGLNPANILCGNGSDELLGLLCHVYLGTGDEAIITEHGFLVYKIQIMGAGACRGHRQGE